MKVNVGDVNDNRPVFESDLYMRTLGRNAKVNDEVVVVWATDADSGQYGEVEYSIISGNSRQIFSINPDTGEIA